MKPIFSKTPLLLITAIFLSCSGTQQVANQSSSAEAQLSQQLVGSVLWYQQSAEMVAAYYQAYRYGEMLLEGKLDTLKPSMPAAVVLDIDETVLDNSPYEAQLIATGSSYESGTWKIWTAEARAKALPGALEFVNFARKKGVDVFYISNRKTDELNATIENLKKYNFPNANPEHILLKTTTSDKTARREQVASKYNILVFVGDNLTDYSELFANRDKNLGKDLVQKYKDELLSNFVMLPNPMYGEWEKAIYDNNFSISTETKLQKRQQLLQK